MKCNNLSDVLLDLIERQSKELREEDDRIQMQGEALFSESGRKIEYGKRTKRKKHFTPDTMPVTGTLFDDIDHDAPAEPLKDWEGEHHDTR